MAKTFVGTVSSAVADKTIVVTVNSSKTHPLYHKQYTVSKKFMAHDEKNVAALGDRVAIVETRPLSKRKRFALKEVIEKAPVQHVEAETPLEVKPEVASEAETKEAKEAKEVKETKPAKKAPKTEEKA